MSDSLYFYDLETSGFSARAQRIMQFGGQRTDMDLKPIAEPLNVLIKLPEDILPDPEAIFVHGVTPQKTLEEGYSEPEFLKILSKEVLMPRTTVVGFNNVRFDDEFMRHLMYRNFYDPYAWQWQDNRSRWDILDMVRMTRALRPDGIKWAYGDDGKPSNRLEELAIANNISHANAHDALADVKATIDLAKLVKQAQPKLYDWLFKVRSKKEVAKLVNLDNPQPFVYTSGLYASEGLKTSIAIAIAPAPANPNALLVYDLRFDPTQFINMPEKELLKHAFLNREQRKEITPLPIKSLALNRCPAVAPLGVLNEAAEQRIKLSIKEAENNLKLLLSDKTFGERIRSVWEARSLPKTVDDVEFQLYEGFFGDKDAQQMRKVRERDTRKLADWHPTFDDPRLEELLLHYKARNFPTSLDEAEEKAWKAYKNGRLLNGLPGQASLEEYMKRLQKMTTGNKFLREQLKLYGELLAPSQTLF